MVFLSANTTGTRSAFFDEVVGRKAIYAEGVPFYSIEPLLDWQLAEGFAQEE